jgi:hypothetical protein
MRCLKVGHAVASAIAFFIAAWTLTAFAADLRIDGRSKDSFDRSVKTMADSLSEDDKKVFAEGLMNLILTEYPPAKGMSGFALITIAPQAIDAAPVTVNGKTLSEIMARGRAIARDKSAAASLKANVKSDDQRRLECLRSKVHLSNVSITPGSFGSNIILQVTNKLGWSISGVRIAYKVTSQGRPIPWAEENFATSIAGGIQPNETRKISTTAMLSADAPQNVSVEATVLDVADQDKALYVKDVDILGWSDKRSDRSCD